MCSTIVTYIIFIWLNKILITVFFFHIVDAKKNKGQRALPKGWYQSKSAYMLVYTRSDALESMQQGKTSESNDLKLPFHLEKFVNEQNELFETWVAQTKISNV